MLNFYMRKVLYDLRQALNKVKIPKVPFISQRYIKIYNLNLVFPNIIYNFEATLTKLFK